ncbi:MAG TPA: DUF3488 and transglutaminase-like domain-containing protein [Pseudonocardiaceae bacterium]|jgi:transglutaminase-like putative cysteine protease|nr:DUF3488 and transglutaminase-like domain-containing protein [Pseudonocardiaceae bacterium]
MTATAMDDRTAAGSLLAMPTAAAVAVVCASTAVSGVVGGLTWLVYVVVVTMVVAAAGVALRALRTPAPLVWIGQAFVLLCLAVTLFTSTGVLVVLPGPTSLGDLGTVLSQSVAEVRTGVPPVTADAPILCLIVVAIGTVAIAVDNLAVTARVPATAGLILLCVYAVPASLDDNLLPWWSFVLGTAAFTMMLAVDGVARHQAWRGKLGLPSGGPSGVAPAATAVTAVAAVIALFVGGTFTVVGTVGRLPGVAGGGTGGDGNLGINPISSLQGLLTNKSDTELFDVTGLPANAPYLTAVTLSTYVPGKGFVLDPQMNAGVAANSGPLQGDNQITTTGPASSIRIQPVHWEDLWLPIFGTPQRLAGVAGTYRYDASSGFVFSQHAQKPGPYTELTSLAEPSQATLRSAGTDVSSSVDPKYLAVSADQRVKALAEQLTSNADTEFDKALAIWNLFRGPGSPFTYSTQTPAPRVNDPLVDFLFYGRSGFCEQYATAMAVLLREVGVPVRVAIGFTDGYSSNGHQVITSQDAHAWDEVDFPGLGWFPFDPTPLGGGRSHTPSYLQSSTGNTGSSTNSGSTGHLQEPDGGTGGAHKPTTSTGPAVTPGANQANGTGSGAGWQWWTVLALAVLSALATALALGTRGRGGFDLGEGLRRWHRPARWAAVLGWLVTVFFAAAVVSWWLAALVMVLGLAATPSLVREVRRRERHQAIVSLGARAVGAAWAEVLAESSDRGAEIGDTSTVRVAAARLVREHGLDEEGQAGLRTLIGAVERTWYGAADSTAGGPDDTLVTAFDGVRASMHRNAPLALRARLWPRSVLHPSRWWRG